MFVALLFLLLAITAPSTAAETPTAPEVLTLDEAAELLRMTQTGLAEAIACGEVPGRRIGGEWRIARAALLDWLAGAEPPPPISEAALAGITAAGTAPGSAPIDPASGEDDVGATVADDGSAEIEDQVEANPAQPVEDGVPIGAAPDSPTAEEVFLRTERVLLAPGQFTIEPGFFYFERQDDVLVFSGGVAAGLAQIDEKAYTFDLRSRVGIFEETEFLAGISFAKVDSDIEFGGTTIDDSSQNEFGDLRLGIRRTLLHEGVGYPDVILTVDGRIPVQNGSYGVGTGLAFVKSFDPAVLFANFNYRHTFSRDFNDVTRLQAEDTFDFALGFAYSLNDSITLSTRVTGVFTDETEFSNATIPQNELFFLELGLTARAARNFYLEPTVAFSLNTDDNRVVLGLTAPVTFGR